MAKLSRSENQLIVVIVVLALLGLVAYGASHRKLAHLQKEYTENRQQEEALTTFFSTTDNANAVFVYDATTSKVLFEKNADAIVPLASVTKLATALTVKKLFDQTDTITISQKALAMDGDNGLVADEVWKRDPLLSFMLVISSNDAAFAFKENYNGDFMQAMNDYTKTIGLEHTTFYNPAGLDLGGKPGAVGTARDMAKLMLNFLSTMPDIAQETMLPQETYTSVSVGVGEHAKPGKSHTISNTNDLSSHIDTLLGSKTGYTNLAGGNLVIAYRMPIYGDTIIIVVLGSTREGRFVDIEKYMDGVENYFRISQK